MVAQPVAGKVAAMRCYALAAVLAGCAAPPPSPPVRVLGEGHAGLVRACSVVDVARPLDGPRRVSSAAEWRALRGAAGGSGLARPAPFEPLDEALVVVPLSPALALRGVEVSTEEGVDVVTVDVEPAAAAGRAARVGLLRIGRRPCQLAVVVRDQARGAERTVAVYPPSR